MLIKDNQKYIFAKKKITPHTHIYIHRWMDGSMMLYTEEERERERLTHSYTDGVPWFHFS